MRKKQSLTKDTHTYTNIFTTSSINQDCYNFFCFFFKYFLNVFQNAYENAKFDQIILEASL